MHEVFLKVTEVHQTGGQVMLGDVSLRGSDRSEAAGFLKC